jgi:hypothetical protein
MQISAHLNWGLCSRFFICTASSLFPQWIWVKTVTTGVHQTRQTFSPWKVKSSEKKESRESSYVIFWVTPPVPYRLTKFMNEFVHIHTYILTYIWVLYPFFWQLSVTFERLNFILVIIHQNIRRFHLNSSNIFCK